MLFSLPILLALAIVSGVWAEPTPQPSVEPSTVAATPSPSTTESSDLTEEGQDQVAILKQINRVNDDGSYTFGYEAADGSFKIETRDVVGNIKEMFGFVDDSGELKRISYSASNGTGFQSTGSPNVLSIISPDIDDSATRLPVPVGTREPTTRISLLPAITSTTERPGPIYIYKSTTRAPKPEVIQHIPKYRPTPASFSTEPTESEEVSNIRRPTYGTLLPKKSATPNYISLKSTTRTPQEDEEDAEERSRQSSAVQSIRPRGYKKLLVTKRPVETSSTPTVSTTTEYYPVTYTPQPLNEDVTNHNEIQRQVDRNSVTEGGLLVSGTEDSPDVYGGGPTPRPFPAGAFRTLFPQIPQYQRILQSPYLQNQYGPQGAQAPLPAQNYGPNGQNYGPQGNGNPGIPNRFQDPAAIAQYAQYARNQQVPYPPGAPNPDGAYQQDPNAIAQYAQYVRNQQAPYPPGAQNPDAYQQDPGAPPAPIPPNRQNIPQPPLNPQNYPPNPDGSLPYPPPVEPQYRPNPRQNFIGRRPQRLPTPSYNPAQGLGPEEPAPNGADVDSRRPYPDPAQYNPNLPPYAPPPQNPQNYLTETLLRMLIAAQSQPRQQPPLSPFQQALLSTLGPNNVPPELFGRGYDPRNYQNYGPYQQRNPYYPQPPYDPRYQQYSGYPDPYSQPPNNYNRYNPYYQQPQYNGYNQNPYPGYSPNPYYQPRPEDILQMFLGAGRFAPPAPQASPQIQTSPAAFDNAPNIPRPPIRGPAGPNGPNPVYGQRIPNGSNIVERSSSFVNKDNPTKESSAFQRTRSKGSRNVQIIDSTSSQSSPTTSKP